MKPVLLLIVVAVVIAVLLWYRRKTPTSTEALPPSNRFHAVTIYSPPNACPSARMLGSTKFLAKEAPRLPLDNCTAPQCQCRYEHYDDRRADERRHVAMGAAADPAQPDGLDPVPDPSPGTSGAGATDAPDAELAGGLPGMAPVDETRSVE